MLPDPPNILGSRFALALPYNIYTYTARPPLQQNPGTATGEGTDVRSQTTTDEGRGKSTHPRGSRPAVP